MKGLMKIQVSWYVRPCQFHALAIYPQKMAQLFLKIRRSQRSSRKWKYKGLNVIKLLFV
jgi:hypothetical protein